MSGLNDVGRTLKDSRPPTFLGILLRAFGRALAMLLVSGLGLVIWLCFTLTHATQHQPVIDISVALGAIITILWLARRFGRGKIFSGLWLALLSVVLTTSGLLLVLIASNEAAIPGGPEVAGFWGILFASSGLLLRRTESRVFNVGKAPRSPPPKGPFTLELRRGMEKRYKFAEKWRMQLIGAVLLTAFFYVGTLEVGWFAQYLNADVDYVNSFILPTSFLVIAAILFFIREQYLLAYGLAELFVGVLTVWYCVRRLPANFNDPNNYIAFVTSIAGALYLMVRAIDNIWKTGAIRESFQIGALRWLVAPTLRLEEAASACRKALQQTSGKLGPLGWAATQETLGDTLLQLGSGKSVMTALKLMLGSGKPAITHLNEAVEAYRAASRERTRNRVPLQWAATQMKLGTALLILGEREGAPSPRLEEAISVYREALQEATRARAPLQWAMLQQKLGDALLAAARHDSGTKHLAAAIEAYDNALGISEGREDKDISMCKRRRSKACARLALRQEYHVNVEPAPHPGLNVGSSQPPHPAISSAAAS